MKKIIKEQDNINQLFLLVDRHLSSLRRRNIAYVLNSLSSKVLIINLFVNGKKGMAQMSLVLLRNKDLIWEVHTPMNSYELSGLQEIAVVVKYIVTRLHILLGKF